MVRGDARERHQRAPSVYELTPSELGLFLEGSCPVLHGSPRCRLAAETLVTLLLDAGLRLGEPLELRWDALAFGTDENDPGRRILKRM